MAYIYPFFISFFMIFLSELGDKTQIIVLSFSNKLKTFPILLGVALGSFFSHGIAILFGSKVSSLGGNFQIILSFITYFSFILFGVIGFFSKNSSGDSGDSKKDSLIHKISFLKLNYIILIAISIFVGEFGDKTFLASMGLGVQYSEYKFSLILGAICGMVFSNAIAVFLGKFIGNKLNKNLINYVSNLLFILFGIIGLIFFNVSVKLM